ncbi:hypothetical protein C8J56DRAFT_1048242 [Mycena floridula]|nr:hypothetical protein C8J56DRAFT_1048242 [Mycena floridula]
MPRKFASLGIKFLIVGGGITGLACAVALRRLGHRVTVLEKDEFLDDEQGSGGCRIPPNMSKILVHWGLEKALREISISSNSFGIASRKGFFVRQLNSFLIFYAVQIGEFLGKQKWNEEMLKESRGEFLFTHYAHLRKLLYHTAIMNGAVVRLGANVASIDLWDQSVKLDSGEMYSGDVILGADGAMGLARQLSLQLAEDRDDDDEEEEEEEAEVLTLFSSTVPRSAVTGDPRLSQLADNKNNMVCHWLGEGRFVRCFALGENEEYAFQVGSTTTSNVDEDCILELAKQAKVPQCTSVKKRTVLEEWTSGRLLVLGQAAHPLPVGSVQEYGMGVEDAAVLAKLFSHLRKKDQIEPFLHAFQDMRLERCRSVLASELQGLRYLTTPIDEEEAQALFRKFAAGANMFDEGPKYDGISQMLSDIIEIWAYDGEDEADNWWIGWGLLRERAEGANLSYQLEIPSRTIVYAA